MVSPLGENIWARRYQLHFHMIRRAGSVQSGKPDISRVNAADPSES